MLLLDQLGTLYRDGFAQHDRCEIAPGLQLKHVLSSTLFRTGLNARQAPLRIASRECGF